MSKLAGLQDALNASTGRAARTGRTATVRAIDTAPATAATVTDISSQPPKGAVANSRAGKDNIAAWLPSEYKRSIRLVQAKKVGDPSLQDLMAEAFNDLFIKYNVPTVSMNE